VRRRGLAIFGVLFVALFAWVAASEGLGDPSIPEGDVLLIEDAPEGRGNVSKADFDHALEIAAAGEQKEVPKPGTKQYDELKETALTGLVEEIWLEGQAEEMDIDVSPEKVETEFQKIKKENFPTQAEFQKFLKESKFTQEDIDQRVKLQILAQEVQEAVSSEQKPSDKEVENYYEAAKATQFTKPPSRDIRLIVNKEEEKAEKALDSLEEGNTAGDWSRIAKEFSEDAATKDKGGLQKAIAEGSLEEPLGAEVFDAPEGQLVGPLKAPRGFVIFEVQSATEETVEPLSKKVSEQISSQLGQQLQQETFTAFVEDFNARWVERTFCAEDYLSARCANYESDGRPATAPPSCYEEEPKGGRPEACPAPVFQMVPAVPGSVTPLAPQGEPLAQRPHPPGEEKEAPEAPPTGIPGGGAVPPTGAPPGE
jgi:foldase protein PrsA